MIKIFGCISLLPNIFLSLEKAIFTIQEREAFSLKYRFILLALCLAGVLTLPVSAVVLTSAEVENSAPIAENLTLTTFKDVAISSRFAATDPEGDPVTFQIVDSPARGQVTVDENDPAAFWYTPYEGKKGKDSFTYVATDSQGNISEPATVKITIEKQNTKVTYSDMTGEAAHYAALRLAEEEIYVGRQVGELYCFDPSDTFTREEFLALAMAVAGAEPLDGMTLTGFYDDETISAWAKGYVSAALMEGTVRGSHNEAGQIVFNGSAPITRAEAAVIVDRLLAIGDVSVETFARDAVPAWATQSVANMDAVAVMAADSALFETMTRAEGAQMLSAMLDVIENREDSNWLW